jgi:hypothetical protein
VRELQVCGTQEIIVPDDVACAADDIQTDAVPVERGVVDETGIRVIHQNACDAVVADCAVSDCDVQRVFYEYAVLAIFERAVLDYHVDGVCAEL